MPQFSSGKIIIPQKTGFCWSIRSFSQWLLAVTFSTSSSTSGKNQGWKPKRWAPKPMYCHGAKKAPFWWPKINRNVTGVKKPYVYNLYWMSYPIYNWCLGPPCIDSPKKITSWWFQPIWKILVKLLTHRRKESVSLLPASFRVLGQLVKTTLRMWPKKRIEFGVRGQTGQDYTQKLMAQEESDWDLFRESIAIISPR